MSLIGLFGWKPGRCLAWDVSPVAPTPFRCLLLFFFSFVLYYKFMLYFQEEYPIKLWKNKTKQNKQTNKTLCSVHFGGVVVELVNCICGGIVRNELW